MNVRIGRNGGTAFHDLTGGDSDAARKNLERLAASFNAAQGAKRSSVGRSGQTANNPVYMREAREMDAEKKKWDPITHKQLAAQETVRLGREITETDVRRMLSVASLPRNVQTLIENRKLAIMTADRLGKANLEPHEKIALANRLVESGETSRVANKIIKIFADWTQEQRREWLTNPNETFEQACERNWEAMRDQRQRRKNDEAQRKAKKQNDRSPEWISMQAINEFNRVTHIIQDWPAGVRPSLRHQAVEGLLNALENGVEALKILGAKDVAREQLRDLLDDMNPVLRLSAADDIVPGEYLVNGEES